MTESHNEVSVELQNLADDITARGEDQFAAVVAQLNRLAEQVERGAPVVGEWGFVDGKPLHLPSYQKGWTDGMEEASA